MATPSNNPERMIAPSPRSSRPRLPRSSSNLSDIDERRTSPRHRADSQYGSDRPPSVLFERRFENTISSMLNRRTSISVDTNIPLPERAAQVPKSAKSIATIPDLAIPSIDSATQEELRPPLKRDISAIPVTYPPDLEEGIKEVEDIRAATSPIDNSPPASESSYSWTAPPDQPEIDGDWKHVKPAINGNVGKEFARDEADSENDGQEEPRGSEVSAFDRAAGLAELCQRDDFDIGETMMETLLMARISNASNASVQGAPSQRLLPTETQIEEIEDETPIREGPSDAKFAKDGFCSCSRFTRLTKEDFTLLAEADKAARRNIPFQDMGKLRDLIVRRIKKQPRHEPSIYYWLATLTNFTDWLTLADRRKEKNRIDNTFFFKLFRDRVKMTMYILNIQRLDRQVAAYRMEHEHPQVEKKKKMEERIAGLRQKQNKMQNLKKRQAKIGWSESPDASEDESDHDMDSDDLETPKKEMHKVRFSADASPKSPTSPTAAEDQQSKPNDAVTEPPPTSPTAAHRESKHFNFASPRRAFTLPVGQKMIKATAKERVTGPVSRWLNTDSPLNLFSPAAKTKGRGETAPPAKVTEVEEEQEITETNIETSESTPAASPEKEEEGEQGSPEEEKPEEEKIDSVFIVIGWFPDDLHEPNEIYVRCDNVEHFLPDLKMHITALRGWRSVFSFKSVQGFGLYKCRIGHFAHSVRPTTKDERVTLAHFFDAANRSYVRASEKDYPELPKIKGKSAWARFRRKWRKIRQDRRDAHYLKRKDSRAWAEWVHHEMNGGMDCPFESQLSLKLILDWSQRRIAIAALIPLALSLGVGIYYMLVNDGVEGTSTAWTISSYIVTAGAFIIALIAILTALKDGQTTSFPRERVADLERGEGGEERGK